MSVAARARVRQTPAAARPSQSLIVLTNVFPFAAVHGCGRAAAALQSAPAKQASKSRRAWKTRLKPAVPPVQETVLLGESGASRADETRRFANPNRTSSRPP